MKNILSINTSMLDGYSIDTWMSFIKGIGISHVEFAFNQGYAGQFDDQFFSAEKATQLKAKLTEYGLQTISFGCTMDMGDIDAVDSFAQRIVFAELIGAVYLNANTTCIAKKDQLLKNLEKLIPIAEKHGRIICIENGGDHTYDAFARASDGIEIIEQFKSSHLAINYDAGNLVSLMPFLSPSEDSLEALPYCAHIHLKDVMVHDDRYTFPAIGRGIINYKKILADIELQDSAIPMSIEKPLRMHRQKDSKAIRSKNLVDLHTIKATVEESVAFVRSCLS